MIRCLYLILFGLTFAACGRVDSDGFLSDHNLCNADLTTFSTTAVVGETPRPISPVDLQQGATFGQKMLPFSATTDLYGVALRLSTEQALTGDLEVQIWAKLDKELAYGQTLATVTPDGEQGVVLAKALVTPDLLEPGSATWVRTRFEEATSVFASGRYWLMYKPGGNSTLKALASPGSGLATYNSTALTWTISAVEGADYQVIPCL